MFSFGNGYFVCSLSDDAEDRFSLLKTVDGQAKVLLTGTLSECYMHMVELESLEF